MDTLTIEVETYLQQKKNLLYREGDWVLIKADRVIGIYGNMADAASEGFRRFYPEPFFVNQIKRGD